MKRYEKYKPSGIEWIGEVPEHWEDCRLKSLLKAKLMYGANESAETDNPDFPRYIRITDITDDGKLKDETFKSLNPTAAAPYLLKRGELLFARSGSVGRTFLFESDIQACFAGYLIKASFNNTVIPRYVFYFTQSGLYWSWISSISIQTTIQNIGAEKYNNMPFVRPTLNEQKRIVAYLDARCADIDKVVATQQRRIVLLQELKQSEITQAVTRGLNPDARMKDSDVEWIGMVPEHWERCRFKDFITLVTKPSVSETKIGLENIESGTGRFIETDSEFEGNGVEFYEDDVVYGKLRPYLQKVWLATFKGNAVGDFFVFREKKNSCSHFLKYLLLSDGFTKEADGATVGAKMPRVSSDFILTMRYYLPERDEQVEIAEYLDRRCGEIDRQIGAVTRQIELLREYKQALITEVVTGKRKV